ncbi:hypothetical protein L207DRAFT_392750, partial [Hyaloscypha variabilis F]
VVDQRTASTGNWIFAEPDVEDWLLGRIRVLWLYALTGAGKTILSSNIIDRLDKYVQENDSQPFAMVYHYCDFKDSRTWSPVEIIASILKQLLTRDSPISDAQMEKVVQDLYNGRTQKRRFVTISHIHELFCSVASVFSRVYIVLDGLDEI